MLPDLPPFPSSMQPAVAAPLSLAEALGAQTPQQRTQLSLAASLSPGGVPVAAEVLGPQYSPGHFTFTLRKADGTDLGLNVSHLESDKELKIEGVRADGAVEAWNRQCHGSMTSEKAVMAGDRIISVNNVSHDAVKMLAECKEKQLLKLTIVRGDRNPAAAAGKVAAAATAASKAATTTMRADASVFVPKGVEPPGTPEKDKDSDKAEAKGDGEVESTAASSVHATPKTSKPETVSERV